MSRSKRKVYAHGWVAGCESIKKDKIRNNKLLRRELHQKIKNFDDDSDLILPEKLEEVMGRWDYSDDGRFVTSLKEAIKNSKKNEVYKILYK